MARRQTTLLALWLKPAKKQKVHVESEIMSAEEQVGNCNLELDIACEVGEAAGNLEAECSKQAYGVTETAIQGRIKLFWGLGLYDSQRPIFYSIRCTKN